ncbi:hypothetical protein GLOTRDRAFT_140362 [Gloeophyllum trabeum ATCC 11539]|uniref:DUF202 domain-containing protein n=1 Tax=Gloeophyllum trabeum (strain ATCC 11539 / FP-39264 / Madison 617) TaxID=670483 RepID=S7PZ23_GLOTA|nr:uncharacterized protein GLOTRDRAFT_140362 [Gloeophyllum trabeum ATCC 11539]EPQ52723.1 hypothetical protein GLOTRDRAFT_140362 [Gloeophyllum trabeum ATCC 11539]
MPSSTIAAAATTGAQARPQNGDGPHDERRNSLMRRSWYAMTDMLSPFSPSALASLPKRPKRAARYTRADHIPDTEQDENGQPPTVRDYHAINSVPPQVRVPKKIPTPIKVEGKVWFANERTWVSYLNIAMLMGTFSLALFNTSKDQIARNFAYVYAGLSVAIVVYGYLLYQYRITLIRRRDPNHFDQIWGPIVISIALFCAVLANFILRVRELRQSEVIPAPSPTPTGF